MPAPDRASPVPFTEVARTVVPNEPTGTLVDDCGYPVGEGGSPICGMPVTPPAADTATPAASPYPAPGTTVQSTAAPVVTATDGPAPAESPAAAAVIEAPIPYADCARAPGLPGCGADAVPLDARLAFADTLAPRLIGLDLQTGEGWQSPLTGEARWLDWSPGGDRLLVGLQGDVYSLYTAGGRLAETFSGATTHIWQPDGQLTLMGTVRSADGWSASLAQTRETRWDLRFRRNSDEERLLPLESLPADSFYAARAWVPGTHKVLLQRYTSSGGALLMGGQLLVADTLAATVTVYDVSAPLNNDAFAFNPIRGAFLALLTSGAGGGAEGGPEFAGPEGGAGLALLDFNTNQLRYPLPEGVLPTGMAWRPDGERLAFSIGPLAPNASDAARQVFSAPGIYLLDPQTGAVEPLAQSPAPALDSWPHWSADGQALLYARLLPQQDGSQGVEIRARRLASGEDWLLVQGLPAPPTAAGRPAWNRVIAFGR